MSPEDIKRKLTAIFSADVEGYSRLMGDNELATVQTLTSYKETMKKQIKHYRGRVVDSTGDNLLAEFASVVDAVQCAVEVQQVLNSKNDSLPENRRMFFRIGINLGDVLEEGDRIFGDGVNIAARIESLADGGGICISGTAYDQIKNKLALAYDFLGEHTVKNISDPVRVYKVPMGPVEVKKKVAVSGWKKAAIAAGVVLILAGVAGIIWHYHFRPTPIEPASVEKMTFQLPEKPSIAVLPFVNMSGDPEQEYIADGITENITTALSKIPEMFVIARTSSMTYKGKPIKVNQVSEELGVRYVLEGSVQKEGDRVRITAQLVDAIKGHHLWAEQYDRDMKGFFDLLDEITKEIGAALQVQLTWGDYARYHSSTDNFEAWGLFNEAYSLYLRAVSERKREDNVRARVLLEKAFKLDPEYARALLVNGWTHLSDVWFGWSKSPQESIERAVELAQKAGTIDESHVGLRALWSVIYSTKGQYERAIEEAEKAIAKDPNWSIGYISLGAALYSFGRFEEAIPAMKTSIRLHGPYFPANLMQGLAAAYSMAGHYEKAISTYKKYFDRCKAESCLKIGHLGLAMTYVWLGQEEEARNHAAEVLKIDPKVSLERYAKRLPWKNKTDIDRVIDALRKAGLPDKPPAAVPDKPSIAVLPFANISGDPKEDYLSDGITEQIITALSKTPRMLVIASNSVFTYKGKPVKVQQVSKDLGVRYVLEGSVQKSGDRLRVTAQLIDAKSGNHLWSERYDRDVKDLFDLQDDITKRIISALHVKLTIGDTARICEKGTNNLQAYLKLLKGVELLWRVTKDDNALARQIIKEVIALDPEYARAYSSLGKTYWMDATFRWTEPGMNYNSMERAIELAKKAISLDPSDFEGHTVLARIYAQRGRSDMAMIAAEKAISLAPNSADANAHFSIVLARAFDFDKAIVRIKKAMRLNPITPAWFAWPISMAYRPTGRYEEAVGLLKKVYYNNPNDPHVNYIYSDFLERTGKYQEAIEMVEKAIRLRTDPPKRYFRHLASVYRSMGKDKEAGEVLQRPAYKRAKEGL